MRKIRTDVEAIKDMGLYISACLPKYVQKVQISAGDELEILVCPQGIIQTLNFLKCHQNTQYISLSDLTAVDVPSRKYRFEVNLYFKINTPYNTSYNKYSYVMF